MRELLHYDSETGIFTWKVGRKGTRGIGSVAGTTKGSHGYVTICVDGEYFLGHRLAWIMTYGSLSAPQIDHRNLVKTDNRLRNLRPSSSLQNRGNTCVRSDSLTGVKGVSLHRQTGKWNAHIRINGRKRSLGLFHSIDEAGRAYARAATEHFGEFARAV